MSDEPIEIKVEKLEAKFDMFDNLRKALEEKISNLSEQIGELRSMMIDREKFYKEIELSARKMEAIIELIKKEELMKLIQRREKDVEENKARIERIEKLVEKFSSEMKELRELIAKLKPIDELLELSKETGGKLRAMDEKRNYVDTLVQKIEKHYADVKKFIGEFQTVKSDSDEMKNEIRDILKIVDSLKLEMEQKEIEAEKKSVSSQIPVPSDVENQSEWGTLYAKWRK